MTQDRTDMDIDRMEIVRNLPIPDLTPFRRATPAAACAPGVLLCDELVAADTRSTAALHEFLTRIAQGFAAYRNIATSATQIYAAGQRDSEQRIRASCATAAPGLPGITPTLTAPAEAQ